MPVEVSITSSDGTQIMRRELLRFAGNLEDVGEVLPDVATIMRNASEQQFDTEGGYASGGWPQLAPSTVAKRGDAHPILVVTEALKDSLTRKFDPNHVERIVSTPSEASLAFGSTVPYFVFHQSDKPRAKIPYRPPAVLTQLDKRMIVKTLQAKLIAGVRVAA